MAVYKQFGTSSQNLPQPDWSVSDNGRGLLEGSAKIFFSNQQKIVAGLPTRLSVHPYDDRLICHTSDISFQRNGIGYCEAKYIGIKSGDVTLPEWTLSAAITDQPIQFHPDFVSWCLEAGWNPIPGSPSTGTVNREFITLDENGQFKEFGRNHPKVPMISQFSVPTGNCKINYYCKSTSSWFPVSIAGVARWTELPPFGPQILNTSSSPVNWLITGSSVTEYGNIYKVEVDLQLSILGKKNNPFVYKQAGTN